MPGRPQRAAVVGAGSIGVGIGVVFARAGFDVVLWDPDEASRDRAAREFDEKVRFLASHGVLGADVDTVLSRVDFADDLGTAVRDVDLVQECAPERLELKRRLYADLARETAPHTVLAGSSSALVPSSYARDNPAADRIVGAHPGNPPYLLPVIELIASPTTSVSTLDSARALYVAAGMNVVDIRHEVEGFVFNRLQGALLREAYCLVRDGVASAADIDEVVKSGLGRRWAFMGPFETVDLNTRGGIGSHAEKMGPAYERMGAERGQHDPWTRELVAEVEQERRQVLPLERWDERVAWRDEQLVGLAALFAGDAEIQAATRP